MYNVIASFSHSATKYATRFEQKVAMVFSLLTEFPLCRIERERTVIDAVRRIALITVYRTFFIGTHII